MGPTSMYVTHPFTIVEPFRLHRTDVFRFLLPMAISLLVQAHVFLHAADPARPVDFAHEIVPLLKKNCVKCHAGESKKGGFTFNTRNDLLRGSENGPVVALGNASESRLIEVVTATDKDERMPPDGDPLSASEVDLLKRWIHGGATWQEGYAFKPNAYEPPLKPRKPALPPAQPGRNNPIDRIIDHYLADHDLRIPAPVSDATFARRASLDLVGLLPNVTKLDAYLKDTSSNKRGRFIQSLLADDMAYAEHWLTFWNDLLRNDYDGTGFITGGRRQISGWLYDALITNKPYDQMIRELIAPTNDESRGFIEGIKWRGEVSAGQTVEIQFAQSISQSLLGINMKCASCHDSFIDRWKLDEAYGLAAIYSTKPIEVHRCDKPVGRMASASWLFPEIGQVDATAPQPERLRQLAALMTHPDNGRFSRTIVNRLWHRMLGHGIVHPTDAMQTEPWNADLLDFLASDFAEHGYDLKHTLQLITESQAYQSRSQVLENEEGTGEYVYGGIRAKRLTAEQFLDTVWQLTGAAPNKMDAKFFRGKIDPVQARSLQLKARWIWSSSGEPLPEAGEKRTFRKRFELPEAVEPSSAAVTCDNRFTLYLNGKKQTSGDDWTVPKSVVLGKLAKGANELMIVVENLGDSPNPAGLYVQARLGDSDKAQILTSDESWEWTREIPNDNGKFGKSPEDWQPAVVVTNSQIWSSASGPLQMALARSAFAPQAMVRAALLKSNPLMRSLGRPNRDQIVTMRPNELSTLEAIDLANGEALAKILSDGASDIMKRKWSGREELVNWLYRFALSRAPTSEETSVALELIGQEISARGIEDLLWAVLMLPEYQFVR